jgi:hypothetical protein
MSEDKVLWELLGFSKFSLRMAKCYLINSLNGLLRAVTLRKKHLPKIWLLLLAKDVQEGEANGQVRPRASAAVSPQGIQVADRSSKVISGQASK